MKPDPGLVSPPLCGRVWCGPYAIALLSGATYSEVQGEASRMLNRTVRRMHFTETLRVSKAFGLGLKSVEGVYGLTLTRALDSLRPGRLHLVRVTGHIIAVDSSDWTYCDNQTKRWVPIAGSKMKRKKVRSIWEVKQ